ncbi:hypothetical protein [Sporomusa acidovorans]|nr:hypothetical protein [Sporomusa acidovorans]
MDIPYGLKRTMFSDTEAESVIKDVVAGRITDKIVQAYTMPIKKLR